MDEAAKRRAYLDLLDHILDTMFLTEEFSASMRGYQLGALSVLWLKASARQSRRLATTIAKDRYDSIGVQYIAYGTATGTANGRPFVSTPGTILLLDYSKPFTVIDREDRDVVNIAVPRTLFPTAGASTNQIHGMILNGPESAALAAFLHALPTTLEALPASAGPTLSRAFLDLLAVSQGSFKSDDVYLSDHRNARLVRRAERLVDMRIGSQELSPAWLAEKLNVSRTELYVALETYGGVSRFILGRRLLMARAALETASDTRRIGEIAFAFGFTSEAHFARTFRVAFGMTASEARRASLSASSALPRRRKTDQAAQV